MNSFVSTSKQIQSKQNKKSPNDIIYTPKSVALKMIEMCNITPNMKVLDPSKGAGVFYDNLPECHKDWCEITDNKDFFSYTNKVDCIVGNPPYSLWSKWLEHTMKLTDKFCYIFGNFNLTDDRLRNILNAGYGITKFHMPSHIIWWLGRALNPRPRDYDSPALPLSYRATSPCGRAP